MALDTLIALHSVPRPGKPATYIKDLADSIRINGYGLNEAIPVIQMPDGRRIMAGGHHRAAAMASLGEQQFRLELWTGIHFLQLSRSCIEDFSRGCSHEENS